MKGLKILCFWQHIPSKYFHLLVKEIMKSAISQSRIFTGFLAYIRLMGLQIQVPNKQESGDNYFRRFGKIGKKRIKMRIKFDEPIIGKDNVLEIGSKDLDDFYISASDTDRMN